MGSSASALCLEQPGGDLRLPHSGLRFTHTQLRALNLYVDCLYEEDQKGRLSTETESAVENLVQRIVDGAGQRDQRFRCCHIIALHRGKKIRSRSLEYLVTLDSLPPLNSEECRLHEGPVGYGRICLSGKAADKWEEFLTPTGYLCRDKLVERWVELIARCTHARGGGGSRVVSARAAARAKPAAYCYLEKALPPQKVPDRRLAIVEGAAWVMVRVGAGEAEAKLMLGIRAEGCSPAAYSTRVPLTNPMALLHYTAAQGGYYATAVGPPLSMVCPERAATWQLWHPALEATLDGHCSEQSTVAKIAGALNALVDRMREGAYEGTLRVLSRYAVYCAWRRRLDRSAAYAMSSARSIVSAHASHHVLLILDSLLYLCEKGGTAGYVYPVERGSLVRRGSRDSDWAVDAACIRSCLLQFYQVVGEDIPQTPTELLEAALFSRWEHMNKCLGSGAGTTPSYSRQQLRYLYRGATELVAPKNLQFVETHSTSRANLIQATSLNQEAVEDLIQILAIMLDQARDLYLNNQSRSLGEFDRELTAFRTKKWRKLKDYYDASAACLVDAVRRDPGLLHHDLTDDLVIMKQILNWLYKGAKEDKKYLGPVLKPYLDDLFRVSQENSWFLDDFDSKRPDREIEGLKEYCMGVHDGSIEPCTGLLEAAKKMAWAKSMVDFVDKFKHVDFRLVFPTGDGMAISYPLDLSSRRDEQFLTLSRRDKAEAKLRLARRSVLAAFASALVGQRPKTRMARQESSDEILTSIKSGTYWRTSSKPDIIPSPQEDRNSRLRKSRRHKTSYGFPEVSLTDLSDAQTMRRKYHTLRSLVYTEPVESIKELRRRPRSAGSTLRSKDALSRPSLVETLDFINGVKNALSVEESGTSDAEDSWSREDEWLVGQTAPLNLITSRSGVQGPHWVLAELVPALLNNGKFTVLQELCVWLGEASEGALFALHRLARSARSRSSERATSSWRLPEAAGSKCIQKYKPRPLDYMSGDEASSVVTPPPLPPRNDSREKYSPQLESLGSGYTLCLLQMSEPFFQIIPCPSQYASDLVYTPTSPTAVIVVKRHIPVIPEFSPPKRIEDLERHISYLELVSSRLNLNMNNSINSNINSSRLNLNTNHSINSNINKNNFNYTGIINPIYDIKIPKDKFSSVKRSKSLGRSFGNKNLGLEITRYNLTLGHRGGKKTNDVVTAMKEMTGETGLEPKSNFFQRNTKASVVGDSYKVSRVTID